MLKYFTILIFLVLLVFLFIPQAQAGLIKFDRPVTLEGVEDDIGFITCWIGRIGFMLIIIYVIWAGLRMITAGASAEKFSKAGKAFQYVLIGGLVILGTSVIIDTIAYTLGVSFITPIFCF